jgi:hypothetical protein
MLAGVFAADSSGRFGRREFGSAVTGESSVCLLDAGNRDLDAAGNR